MSKLNLANPPDFDKLRAPAVEPTVSIPVFMAPGRGVRPFQQTNGRDRLEQANYTASG